MSKTYTELERKAKAFCDSIEIDGSIGSVYTAMAGFVLSLQVEAERNIEQAWCAAQNEWDRQGMKPGAFTAFKTGFKAAYAEINKEAA